MFWLLARGRTHAFGLVDVLVRIIIVRAELLVWFNLDNVSCVIFCIKNNVAIIIGILDLLYCLIFTFSVNANNFV